MAELEHAGKYQILAEFGRDRAATVYRAHDVELGREVALWVLDAAATGSPERAAAIVRQARALSQLSHPHLIAVLDGGEAEGRIFIATEPVDGPSLVAELARRGRLPWTEALAILEPIADALDYLHLQGVVHGDLRPENILLDSGRGAMLAGLGTARLAGEPRVAPAYIAPELRAGEEPSFASDVYALASVNQDMLKGRMPAEAIAVLQWALAREPSGRPPSAAAFVDALQRCAPAPAAVAAPAEAVIPAAEAETLPAVAAPAPGDLEGARPAPEGKPAKQGRGCLRYGVIAGGILVLLLLMAVFISWQSERQSEQFEKRAHASGTAAAHATQTARPGATQTAAIARTTQMALAEAAIAAGPVFIPAGEFLMGSDESDQSDEKPQHSVYLDAYWIDRVEVTNGMYARCVEAGACKAPSDTRSSSRGHYYGNPEFQNHPVINVTWADAQAYCRWVESRLPTEAEREKAARGLNARKYPWGNETADAHRCNCGERLEDSTPVGSYPEGASPYGALDMAGNVEEWVADWYDPDYYRSSPARNPIGPATGQARVLRGGSWLYGAWSIRTAERDFFTTSVQDPTANWLGFRCARSE